MQLSELLFGRPHAMSRWLPAAAGLFVISTLLVGGFLSLLSTLPETAELLFEPLVGTVMVLTGIAIVGQSLRDSGLFVSFGLAAVPVAATAVATELLFAAGVVGFDIPLAERGEIYGLLFVFSLVCAVFLFATGALLAWRVRTAPADYWVWRVGSRCPPEPGSSRIDAWVGSLGPTGFSLVVVAIAVAVAIGYFVFQLTLGVDDTSLLRLLGSAVLNALFVLGLIFFVKRQRPTQLGSG